GLPISATTLTLLGDATPELREPWPREALDDLLVLLGSGRAAPAVIEALDRTGLWGRLLPEWGAVRDLPPRDVIHTWTVDRHLVETAVQAAALATRVSRPDLLVLGALLHDLGKGRGGDHSVVGAELANRIGKRLGLPDRDVQILHTMVRHHLLLPDTATRRDLEDPDTVARVVDTLDGDVTVLELLHALAEADSLATGPGVWNDWKARLIGDLAWRCRLVMAGSPLPAPAPPDPAATAIAADGGIHVAIEPDTAGGGSGQRLYAVTVIAPDTAGLLSASAGVLALFSLRVWSAAVQTHRGAAINSFVVAPRFGEPPEPELLRQELIRALNGDLDLIAQLSRKERDAVAGSPLRTGAAGVPTLYSQAPPRIIWSEAVDAVILEIRSEDRLGLLCRLAAMLAHCGADVQWAKVSTLGVTVIDSFGLDIGPDAPARRADIEAALMSVLPQPEPRPGRP
ncbi:MAG: HD domain-containing protein, partial [Streptomycetaceae bacterium]|nr:HD domain-containing protein [Streptomycetaceae bacterium]